MPRPIATKLTCLLLLLALFAGGQTGAFMAMPAIAGEQPTAGDDMPGVNCKACDDAAASSTCGAQCASLPAILANMIALDREALRTSWSLSSQSGPTHFISPDTSPPRA